MGVPDASEDLSSEMKTMLAAIKMEVMTPSTNSPDEGCVAIDFHLPPICSLIVRPAEDIYCLDADGALFDAALLSAVAVFSHLQIPIVSLNDDGKIVLVSEEGEGAKLEKPVNKEKRKHTLSNIPFSLTCILYKNYIMKTLVTVVLDSSARLVSFYKSGGSVLAYTLEIQDCVALTRQRVKELQEILDEAISGMEIN